MIIIFISFAFLFGACSHYVVQAGQELSMQPGLALNCFLLDLASLVLGL